MPSYQQPQSQQALQPSGPTTQSDTGSEWMSFQESGGLEGVGSELDVLGGALGAEQGSQAFGSAREAAEFVANNPHDPGVGAALSQMTAQELAATLRSLPPSGAAAALEQAELNQALDALDALEGVLVGKIVDSTGPLWLTQLEEAGGGALSRLLQRLIDAVVPPGTAVGFKVELQADVATSVGLPLSMVGQVGCSFSNLGQGLLRFKLEGAGKAGAGASVKAGGELAGAGASGELEAKALWAFEPSATFELGIEDVLAKASVKRAILDRDFGVMSQAVAQSNDLLLYLKELSLGVGPEGVVGGGAELGIPSEGDTQSWWQALVGVVSKAGLNAGGRYGFTLKLGEKSLGEDGTPQVEDCELELFAKAEVLLKATDSLGLPQTMSGAPRGESGEGKEMGLTLKARADGQGGYQLDPPEYKVVETVSLGDRKASAEIGYAPNGPVTSVDAFFANLTRLSLSCTIAAEGAIGGRYLEAFKATQGLDSVVSVTNGATLKAEASLDGPGVQALIRALASKRAVADVAGLVGLRDEVVSATMGGSDPGGVLDAVARAVLPQTKLSLDLKASLGAEAKLNGYEAEGELSRSAHYDLDALGIQATLSDLVAMIRGGESQALA